MRKFTLLKLENRYVITAFLHICITYVAHFKTYVVSQGMTVAHQLESTIFSCDAMITHDVTHIVNAANVSSLENDQIHFNKAMGLEFSFSKVWSSYLQLKSTIVPHRTTVSTWLYTSQRFKKFPAFSYILANKTFYLRKIALAIFM